MYIKVELDRENIFLLLYVDDTLFASENIIEIRNVKRVLASKFEMKDLGVDRKNWGWRLAKMDTIKSL